MARSILFVSSFAPEAARQALLASGLEIDVAVISPSDRARETAGFAMGDRWVATLEEPLLASRAFAESGADVLARLAKAMRGIVAHDAQALLVVVDGLDVLGAAAFALDEAGALRAADDLERLLPQP
jgi:broad specificity phosphatase PhoE